MGIVVAGAMLVWGGEIGDFVRRIIMLTLAISLIVFSANILATLFSVSGAVLPCARSGEPRSTGRCSGPS
jgi:type IV secretion system protein VirB2